MDSIKKGSIKITYYQKTHKVYIDEMLQEISLEFNESIFSESTNLKTLLPGAYWVALNDNKVIGTIGIIKIKNKTGILKKMMLKKSFRGKDYGVSKLLLQTAINWCIENSINQIYLGTMKQFKAAQVFYEKNGFRRISENELPNGFLNNPLDEIFFQREL